MSDQKLSDAYKSGYNAAKDGRFFRPNPHPCNREIALAWDRGYEAFTFEQRRSEARLRHAQGWADCKD